MCTPESNRPVPDESVVEVPVRRRPGRQRWSAGLWVRWLRRWRQLRPTQRLTLGLLSYVLIGIAALALPFAQARPTGLLDNLFIVTSAISTTGLTTVSVSDHYTFFGELVLVTLFQLGGIGYMTISSFIMLARGQRINDARLGVLRAGFTLPDGWDVRRYIMRVVVFTVIIEALGVILLYVEFRAYDIDRPLWFAIFHTVSAFATAGFSLSNTSLEPFRDSWIINLTIGGLSYLGAIGFIVLQDAWQAVRSRRRHITFTSKVILVSTAVIFVVGTALLFCFEPTIRELPMRSRLLASMFQIMTASSTAGFNTIPISGIGVAAVMLFITAMIVGASPSGTGGGIKTTSLSALAAVMVSAMRGRGAVMLYGHEVPIARVLHAVAATAFYLFLLAVGIFALGITEDADFGCLAFEAVSALGTVGLSMGITADLTPIGKIIITALMFFGRVGPLTLGLALIRPEAPRQTQQTSDLAV
jgi:trk system potassium uptake protein TrkH